ncbi:MAG: TadE/TadG family type IV pilus assembly protein [Sphingomicrobium sp.]
MRATLLHNRDGASAAEFAMVLPLLLLFIFGIIDAGRFLWEFNRAEKATQVGARVAIVTDAIPGGLAAADYIGVSGLTQGDIIPASALGKMTCSRTACSCTGTCPATGTINTAAFDEIARRMRQMKPEIANANIQIEYRGSGLGYAGDPNGMDISPIVTVRLVSTPTQTALKFTPITTKFLGGISFNMPEFAASLTAEDSSGSQSN